MILNFYQNIPLYIDPIAFSVGSFGVRWYSLSYIIGFIVAYFILVKSIMNSELKKDAQISNFQFSIFNKNFKFQISNLIIDFLLLNFFAALIGGRLGYVFVYNFSYFISNPISIISPYQEGEFIGFYGMSYHGALVGIILSSYIFLKFKKINFWAWADFVAPAAALGYFFGRIGNFLNGELYGRITKFPLGMRFAVDSNFLRHPSQLYEAFFEGLLLFLILKEMNKRGMLKGRVFATYLILYASFRIFIEFFREPDSLIFELFTMGQLLSFIMAVFGFGLYFLLGGFQMKKFRKLS